MTTEVALIIGALLLAGLVLKWYGEKKADEAMREIFEEQQNKIIADRDAAIKKAEQESKDAVDKYYQKRSHWISNHQSGISGPPEDEGS